MKSVFAITAMVMLSGIVRSQGNMVSIDSVLRIYDEQSIYLRSNRFVQNGEKKRFGFYLRKYKKEISQSPEALESFKRYRRLNWMAAGCIAVSVPAAIGVSVATGSPAGYLVLFAGYTAGLALAVEANNDFVKSAWLYNRHVLEHNLK